jgi:hypothetical protein
MIGTFFYFQLASLYLTIYYINDVPTLYVRTLFGFIYVVKVFDRIFRTETFVRVQCLRSRSIPSTVIYDAYSY